MFPGFTCKVWGGSLLIYRIDCSFNFFEIASAHFVGKFTRINIVDFFITRSITSNKFVLSSLNQEIRLLAIFNLVLLSYIHSAVLLSVLFWKKYQKRGSRVRHSVLPLFKSRLATSFSRFTPRPSLLVAMLGAARTRFAQTSCHLFPSIARLLTVPPNAALPPLAGNYLCEEDSLTYPMYYSA